MIIIRVRRRFSTKHVVTVVTGLSAARNCLYHLSSMFTPMSTPQQKMSPVGEHPRLQDDAGIA